MPKNLKIKKITNQYGSLTGFTLIELITALGVFSFVIVMSSSIFLNLQNAEKKVQNEVNLQDNIRFALEMMAKEIRTGKNYHCGFGGGAEPLDCPSGDASLTFENAKGKSVIFRQIGARIEKSSDGGDSFQPLTSADISIEDLTFYVTGATSGDDKQSMVIMTIKAAIQTKGAATELLLQTTASQRKLTP